MSQWWFAALIGLVVAERVAEMVISRRNAAWSFARGGREYGARHYPAMVVLHTAFLAGAMVEVFALDRGVGWWSWLALAVAVLAQGLRWWCVTTLGRQWNTRVIVVPGAPRITGGPYRLLPHPNYLAVVAEGIALPMIHTAWLTAVIFTVLNAGLLWRRIGVEEQALRDLHDG